MSRYALRSIRDGSVEGFMGFHSPSIRHAEMLRSVQDSPEDYEVVELDDRGAVVEP
jgi:hypothetical protein